jgi:hypothetical protein
MEMTPLELLGFDEKVSFAECLAFIPDPTSSVKEAESMAELNTSEFLGNSEDARRLEVPNASFTAHLVKHVHACLQNFVSQMTCFQGIADSVPLATVNKDVHLDPFSNQPGLTYTGVVDEKLSLPLGGTVTTYKSNPCYELCALFGVTFYVSKGNHGSSVSDLPVLGWMFPIVDKEIDATFRVCEFKDMWIIRTADPHAEVNVCPHRRTYKVQC